jgi:hypothetical protein
MKGPRSPAGPQRGISEGEDCLPREVRDLLDHLAKELAAECQSLRTSELGAPAGYDRVREMEADR